MRGKKENSTGLLIEMEILRSSWIILPVIHPNIQPRAPVAPNILY